MAHIHIFEKNYKEDSTWAMNGHYLLKSEEINPLKMNGRSLYIKTQSVPRCNTFHLGYKNQSVYAVSGTSKDRYI
jgi:hypothetical protein